MKSAVVRDHVVQFYDSDPQLAGSVATYLAEAVRAGGAAVVIAEQSHRRLFAEQLEVRGVDVAAARRDGALLERDAGQTLSAFCRGDGLDPDRFARVVGELLRAAHGRGGPVRAYGEMVALLWRAGERQQAVALERLWNQLDTGAPFSLFCSYPMPGVGESDELLRHVAEAHSAVHGPHLPDALQCVDPAPDVVGFFDVKPSSPAAVRALVSDVLHSWDLDVLIFDAALIVTELASNAVRHARSGFDVTLSRAPAGVRITVADADPTPPQARPLTPTAPTGRGLHLVEGIAHRWGVQPRTAGKTVWAELAHPAPLPALIARR